MVAVGVIGGLILHLREGSGFEALRMESSSCLAQRFLTEGLRALAKERLRDGLSVGWEPRVFT